MPDTATSYKAKYSADRQRIPNELCALQDFSQGYNATIGLWKIPITKLYFSGWCYRDDYAGTAMNSTNRKLSGNFGHVVNDSYGYPQERVGTDGANNYGEHQYAVDANMNALDSDYYQPSADLWDRWFRIERYVDTDVGVSWIAHDLHKDSEIHNVQGPFDDFILGQYFRTDGGALLKMYRGELYVDTTMARIELGNAPVFDQCTHREIQIPVSWSNTQATFTANPGTFSSTADTYLFVVDADGKASPGLLVTAGGTEDPGPPAEPGQPRSSPVICSAYLPMHTI